MAVINLLGAWASFFQNCVHGGRVMCANNEKQFVEEDIEDLDANSLYPSAMKYFEGYLLGKPKRLKTTNYERIKKYSGYFVKVRINKVGTRRRFPTMCYTDKKLKSKTGRVILKVEQYF